MAEMKRRAQSPLIAEVLIIFITVVAAIPLGGFVFGLFGTYTKTADVSVSFVDCTPGLFLNTTACAMNLDNIGSANAQLIPSSYLLIFYGRSTEAAYTTSCKGTTGDLVKAGSSLVVDCTFAVPPGQPGDRFTGWVALVSGQDLPSLGVSKAGTTHHWLSSDTITRQCWLSTRENEHTG